MTTLPKTVAAGIEKLPVATKQQDQAPNASKSSAVSVVPSSLPNNGATSANLPSAPSSAASQSDVVDKGIL